MGILANVAFVKEVRERTYEDIDCAAEALRWMVGSITSTEKEKLDRYLTRNGTGRLIHATEILWAVIWWEKGGLNTP